MKNRTKILIGSAVVVLLIAGNSTVNHYLEKLLRFEPMGAAPASPASREQPRAMILRRIG